jgi:hypothetical protein
MHVLLWLTNALDLNELIQQFKNDKIFKHGLLKYLDNIIVQTLITQISRNYDETNNFDWNNINPCSTMPLKTNDINFEKSIQRDLSKLINTCHLHDWNLACYKNN